MIAGLAVEPVLPPLHDVGAIRSLACTVFFKCQTATIEKHPQRRTGGAHLTLLEKLRQQLADREIRRRFDQRQEIVAIGVELAALGRTLPARHPIVRPARAAHPDDRRRIADPEPFRRAPPSVSIHTSSVTRRSAPLRL